MYLTNDFTSNNRNTLYSSSKLNPYLTSLGNLESTTIFQPHIFKEEKWRKRNNDVDLSKEQYNINGTVNYCIHL